MDHRTRIDIAKHFSQEAMARYGEHIDRIILYGSVSRGDDDADSDIDILVITDDDKDLQKELSFLSFDYSYQNRELLSVQAVKISDYQEYGHFSFFRNVQKDGMYIG
jgi:predicted nucleotidyltransferase